MWPAFSIDDQPAKMTRCLGWASHYFFPGNVEDELTKCRYRQCDFGASCVLFYCFDFDFTVNFFEVCFVILKCCLYDHLDVKSDTT